MSHGEFADVFTMDEVACAAGVPLDAVRAVVARGDLTFIPGTRFFAFEQAVKASGPLREAARSLCARDARALFAEPPTEPRGANRPALASLAAHGVAATVAVWLSMGPAETAPVDPTIRDDSHLVFLQVPGPGGGGGGGGRHRPEPAPKLARRGDLVSPVSTPPVREKPSVTATPADAAPLVPLEPVTVTPVESAPAPTQAIAAPVQTAAVDPFERDGTVGPAAGGFESHGPGSDGGVGSHRGTGDGAGQGAGIGEGDGGGTGGGPYRPGSGVEAPRLLREVKAEYTEEARRRNLTGEVLLEVIIRRDGTVGSMRVLRSLGAGLDERAVYAVRQWRFAPGRRQGAPVDVVVQVAVEFNLR